MTATTFKRTLPIGLIPATRGIDDHLVELEIEIRDKDKGPELSICGNVWRKDKRDINQGGQIGDSLVSLWQRCTSHYVSRDRVQRIVEIWDTWHLNGMRAGCEHQRATWGDVSRKVEVVSYGLTTAAYEMRNAARAILTDAAIAGPEAVASLTLTPTARALASLDDWFKDRHSPPDADSPLSSCYEVKKREMKAIGWTYQTEHADGILNKPCEVCGYKYGSAWLHETLPAEIIAEIASWFGTT